MQQKKIIFLASDCESSRWVYHALKPEFNLAAAVIEQPVTKKTLIKGRIKKIGMLTVLGQVLFSAIVVPLLKIKARRRKADLMNQYRLNGNEFGNENLFRVKSVNDEYCLQLLKQLQPDIVIVNGTRIISKKILQCTPAVFMNMHVGITPMYRGSHGGYWALYNKDSANFGTTIHVIDTGIDTGAVLKQVFTHPSERDNFTTYPILQAAVGIAALKDALKDVIADDYTLTANIEKGNIYHQPTIWQYVMGQVH